MKNKYQKVGIILLYMIFITFQIIGISFSADSDNDGLDDDLEMGLLNLRAPKLIFHTDEVYKPYNVNQWLNSGNVDLGGIGFWNNKEVLNEFVEVTTIDVNNDSKKDNRRKKENLIWQFIISAKGGANYFSIYSRNPWTGWGESYGWDCELNLIYTRGVGLGIRYGNIYETAIVKEPFSSDIWTHKVIRFSILYEFLFFINKNSNFWVGFGKDNFKITNVEHEFEFEGNLYSVTREDLTGTEIFSILSFGVNLYLSKKISLSPELRYGVNETMNTLNKADFKSLQFLLNLRWKFNIL